MAEAQKNAPVAIILAAGQGTRMRSKTPKVLHKIGGLPMLAHVIARASESGCFTHCIVLAPGMEEVRAAAQRFAPDAPLMFATQTEPLGTAHAVRAAESALAAHDGIVLILYADTPLVTAETLRRAVAAVAADESCALCVIGFTPTDAGAYGRLVVEDGALIRIVEARDASDAERAITLCNSGVMALRSPLAWELLANVSNKNAKGEYYLTDLVAIARARGFTAQVVAAQADEVLGVNARDELAAAEAVFQARARAAHMAKGVTLIDPTSVYFSADTVIGADCLIEPHVWFGPGVRLGANVHVKAFSHLEGATVGDGAILGPFARLRPGASLAEGVHIGNFVEVKQSDIASGAKINHLSYIGDASVGAGTNIGAGTITCNYDGYRKHRTEIGARVFIGSNTALVAPLKIGNGAIVAAGSVITENVSADALAVAREVQQEKPDWATQFHTKHATKPEA